MIFLGDSNALRADIPGNRSEGGLGWTYLRYYEIGSHILREKPDLFVFALGLNDLIRGGEDIDGGTREHVAHMRMRDIIKSVRQHCDVAVCGVLGVELSSNWPAFQLTPACWNKHIVKPACEELDAMYIPHFPNPVFEEDGIHIKNVQENADWVMSHFEDYW